MGGAPAPPKRSDVLSRPPPRPSPQGGGSIRAGLGGSTDVITEKRTLVYREELTPVSFLERAGTVHAERVAAADGDRRYTYREWRARSRRLASAMRRAGLQKD